jgi:GNAT superfamily N-acetyltransferase
VTVSIRDLRAEDLPSCTWAGSNTHLAYVARALDRVSAGEVDYLAICPPSDPPVAMGGVDYTARAAAGTLWQLTVHSAWRSRGLGTLLVRAAEQRIRARGLQWAELSVEVDNPRARALYERLGYAAYAREPDTWVQETPGGATAHYETMCNLMRRNLRGPSAP